jgi:drug/metabolite transporter (DMT)-like permease
MPDFALGLAAACVASILFDAAVALQALEARSVPTEHAMRPSLLGRLLRRRRWLLATGMALLGFPFQVLALSLVPISVVQPALAAGLLLLLAMGAHILGERVGRREILATLAIIAGITGASIAAPEQSSSHGGALALALVLVPLAALAAAPLAMRRSPSLLMVLAAGCAYAWTALGAKILADELTAQHLGASLAWLAAIGGAALLGLLAEMSALQRRPVVTVSPTVTVIQVVVPIAAAPLIGGEAWARSGPAGVVLAVSLVAVIGGAVSLMRSAPVAGLLSAPGPEPVDGNGAQAALLELEHQRA